jgi:sulfite reductase alpha subunit-like flavoprotein
VPIIRRSLLSAPDYSPSLTRFTIPVPPGVAYAAGGQVRILPQNDPNIVSQILAKFQFDPQTTLSVRDPLQLAVIPEKVVIRDLFLRYVDLSGRIPPKLAAYGGIADPKSASVGRFLIDEFAPTVHNLTEFLSVLPQLEARSYSIASEKSDTAELIVAQVFIEPDRPGLCTGYLLRPSTTAVSVQFVDGIFKYPEDPQTAMILVALGSGISPLFSILEHRQGGAFGKCFVIVGLPTQQAAATAIQELEEYKEAGVIDELWFAISRADQRLHVSDVIRMNAERIWEIWANPATQLFYCGTPAGFESTKVALVNVTVACGKQPRPSALNFTAGHNIVVESY